MHVSLYTVHFTAINTRANSVGIASRPRTERSEVKIPVVVIYSHLQKRPDRL
jgi:hypothetical protein